MDIQLSNHDTHNTFKSLQALAYQQSQITNSFPKKLWQYLKLIIFNRPNQFEKFIMQSEPNDSALIAKYSKVVKIDLSNTPTSIDHVYLKSLHIDHPLVNFMRNENNQLVDILQELNDSPVLIFIHGLGGQMSQFEPLMALLSQCLEILSLDLPGFGDSRLNFNEGARLTEISDTDQKLISESVGKMSDDDFGTENIVHIVKLFIQQNVAPDKKVVLIGHSMGCILSVKVTQQLPQSKVEGLILLSPPSFDDDITQSPPKALFGHSWITKFPFLVNLIRKWDRLPGLDSASVLRQIADTPSNPPNTAFYIKLRQFRWNLDINTSVLLKYAKGFTKARSSDLVAAIKKFNDNPFDNRVYEKTVFVSGTDDKVTSFHNVEKANDMLSNVFQRNVSTLIEVKNVGHGLLLSKPEFISGKILDHIEHKFPERLHLSPAWVLRIKAEISGDKWGLKNEMKWLKLDPISLNISRKNGLDISPLLGMKTLREGDSRHSPQVLENVFYGDSSLGTDIKLPKGNLIAVIDISADIPPYNPESFESITYYKCATVSKVVPDSSSIRKFIQLVDKILLETTIENPLIAVHCHYGFNRTGFLICCYLVERLEWSVEEAIEGFRQAKPPGIKHRHFIDGLFVRYES